MNSKLGHHSCRVCGVEGLRGVERFVGICYSCNRSQYNQKPPLDDSTKYNFGDDEAVPSDGDREF